MADEKQGTDGADDELPPGPFVKIYGSILFSSIWLESSGTRLLWITLLALADQNGNVVASVRGLARVANITPEECEEGLRVLEAPDPDSKNEEFDGKRVERMKGGWHILNFRRYREMRTPEQIKTAERVKRFRDRKQAETVTGVTRVTVTPEGEGEGEIESKDAVVGATNAQETVASALSGNASTHHDPIREGKTDAQRALELTVALNKGMRDNPEIGEHVNPALANSGHALTAAQQIAEMGIEHAWAIRATYTLAKRHKPEKAGKGIGSIAYIAAGLEKPWQRELAKRAADAAPRPQETDSVDRATPGTSGRLNGQERTESGGRGEKDFRNEAILLFGELKSAVVRRKLRTKGARPVKFSRELDEEYEQRLAEWERDEGTEQPTEVTIIKPETLAGLSPAATAALEAIGGAAKITHPSDKGLDTLVWQFAAAYAGAATRGLSTQPPTQ